MRYLTNSLFAALLLLSAGSARADVLKITLDSPTLTAQPGQTVSFIGTLSNLDPSNAYDLNSCGVTLAGQFTTDCIDPLFTYFPPSLDPLQTIPPPGSPLLTVTINLPYTGTFGPQIGTLDILGGPSSNDPNFMDQNLLGSLNFTVNVVTPEPSAGSLVTLGLGFLALWRIRIARRTCRCR